jgi:sulfotransferase
VSSNQPDKKLIYVAGLPRSGSTLLCQLLDHHPEVYSLGHSSPLSHALSGVRGSISGDPFLLSQLDNEFDLAYQRLANAFKGFVRGWFEETDKPWVVDKNRAWLAMVETLAEIDPEFRMLVCVRELVQLFGSVEAQHRKTVLIDTDDGSVGQTPYGRACTLFNGNGLVARNLTLVRSALEELPFELRKRIHFVKFEQLVSKPLDVMMDVCEFAGLPIYAFNPKGLTVRTSESDSHYRYKFRHQTYSEIKIPEQHIVVDRIKQDLVAQYDWYYKTFYPGLRASGENKLESLPEATSQPL